jgi:hypothetical protein
MDKPRHTYDEVLAAAEQVTTKLEAARLLGCDRTTVIRYCKRWTSLEDVFKAKRGALVDLAERNLQRLVEAGDWPATLFALSKLDRETYGDRVQIDITVRIRELAEQYGLDPDEAVREAQAIVAGAR